MSLRRTLSGAVALIAMMAALAGAVATSSPVRAAPAHVVFGPPAELSKVVLGDTSIDGPSLWASSTGTVRAILGWTGTDAAHHVNVMTSADGIHYGTKYVLPETSIARPAVAAYGDNNSNVVVAWTGTDPAHLLNVRVGTLTNGYTKVTLHENSFTAPSIAWSPKTGDLYLAWAGTDANHSLNVLQIIPRGGILEGTKTTLWQYSSIARPSIAVQPATGNLYLSWTGPNQRIYFATSTNGTQWTAPASSPLSETSDVGPYMLPLSVNNMPGTFLTWRGTDALHSVNVRYTEFFPSWPLDNAKSVLSEQAYGGPVLAYVGVYRHVLLAWTGVDPAHHLNVADIGV